MQHLNSRQSTTKPPAAKELRHTTMLSFGVRCQSLLNATTEKLTVKKIQNDSMPSMFAMLAFLVGAACICFRQNHGPAKAISSWCKGQCYSTLLGKDGAAGCSLHQLEEKRYKYWHNRASCTRYYSYYKNIAELRLHPVDRGQWASKICLSLTNWWDFSGFFSCQTCQTQIHSVESTPSNDSDCWWETVRGLFRWGELANVFESPVITWQQNLCEVNRKHTREP